MMWLGIAWDVLKSYGRDLLVLWYRRRGYKVIRVPGDSFRETAQEWFARTEGKTK